MYIYIYAFAMRSTITAQQYSKEEKSNPPSRARLLAMEVFHWNVEFCYLLLNLITTILS